MVTRKVILLGRYERGRLLGQGSYGKVYYATDLKNGQDVAIKVINKNKIIETHFEKQIMREITAMKLVDHPNIVKLNEVMASERKIYLVLEYVGGGELYDQVVRGRLRVCTARRYFQQLISAVEHCHSRGIYHRDLKPDNLLFDDNGNLKVADFGWSTIVDLNKKDDLLQTSCGTKSYCCPEIIKKEKYDGAKSDIWSCGVILFVLLTGYHPFQDNSVQKMFSNIVTSTYKRPHEFRSHVRNLIKGMLNPNADSRLSIAQIRQNKWFRNRLEEDDDSIETIEPIEQVSIDAYQPLSLNGFDIISLSAGLNLSNIIDDSEQLKVARFASQKPVAVIMSELKNVVNSLEFEMLMKTGVIRKKALKGGRKCVLTIEVKVFEIASSIHLVEMKQVEGDNSEYQKLKEAIRPALEDIVWVWLGEHQNHGFTQNLSAILRVCRSFALCFGGCLQLLSRACNMIVR